MDDTHSVVRRLQFDIYRRMSAEEKVRLVDEMRRIERMLARTGIERRHPGLTPEEVEFRLHELFLGKELAARAYGRRQEEAKR